MNVVAAALPLAAAPYWSPYAIAAGFLVGFIVGAMAMGLIALALQRYHRSPELWADPEQLPDPAAMEFAAPAVGDPGTSYLAEMRPRTRRLTPEEFIEEARRA